MCGNIMDLKHNNYHLFILYLSRETLWLMVALFKTATNDGAIHQ